MHSSARLCNLSCVCYLKKKKKKRCTLCVAFNSWKLLKKLKWFVNHLGVNRYLINCLCNAIVMEGREFCKFLHYAPGIMVLFLFHLISSSLSLLYPSIHVLMSLIFCNGEKTAHSCLRKWFHIDRSSWCCPIKKTKRFYAARLFDLSNIKAD